MCMLCDEEAFYRAYLEHKAKVEAEGKTLASEAEKKPTFAAEAVEPPAESKGRKTPE